VKLVYWDVSLKFLQCLSCQEIAAIRLRHVDDKIGAKAPIYYYRPRGCICP